MTVMFLAYGLAGGLAAAIVTDFIQGMFVNAVFVLLGLYMLFFLFDWQRVLWSLLGAVVLNLIITVNHRRDRYIARS